MTFFSACSLCQKYSRELLLDLGTQPNGNQFVTNLSSHVDFTPLAFTFCTNCFTATQINPLNPNRLYLSHPYLTSKNRKYLSELSNFADFIERNHSFSEGALVLDVGCNDGSFLKILQERGFGVIGIDPGEIPYRYSQAVGIPVVKDFFQEGSNDKHFASLRITAVTSTASFYHVPSPYEWLKEAKAVIQDNGCVAIQFVDLSSVINSIAVDQFYHEHTFLLSFTSVYLLAKRLDLFIVAVEYASSQGGSMRVLITKKENREEETLVAPFLQRDKSSLTRTKIEFFKKGISIRKTCLTNVLKELIYHGEKVVGIGASLRGVSLINFLELPREAFYALAEINPEKEKLFTASSLIPIINESEIPSEVKYYFVLAWTEKEAIVEKFKVQIRNGISLIFPSHPPEVYGDDNLNLSDLIQS